MQKLTVVEWVQVIAGWILRGAAFAGNVALIGMLALIFLSVVLRYAVGSPLYWGDEVITYLMVIMSYAVFGLELNEGRHVRMTVIFERLSKKTQSLFWVILSLLGTFYTIVLLYAMTGLTVDTFRIGAFSMVTRMPLGPWQAVVVLGLVCLLAGFVTMVVTRIATFVDLCRGRVVEPSPPTIHPSRTIE